VRQACTGRTSSAEKCLDRCKSDQNRSSSIIFLPVYRYAQRAGASITYSSKTPPVQYTRTGKCDSPIFRVEVGVPLKGCVPYCHDCSTTSPLPAPPASPLPAPPAAALGDGGNGTVCLRIACAHC
jgi:hypothetical protein